MTTPLPATMATDVAREIAARSLAAAAGAGLKSAHYPAPGILPAVPTLVVWWDGFDLVQGMGEQYWVSRYRAQLFTSVDDVPSDIATIDQLVIPIVDAWDASAHPRNFTLDYAVDGCKVTGAELSKRIPYAGADRYGGTIYFEAQFRRFAAS